MVSLPAPPSTVIWISAARLPVVEKLSLPPLASRTRSSEVPTSMLNGGRVEAVEPDPGAVGGDRERLRAVAAVNLDGVAAGAALVQVGIITRVPDHAVVVRLAEDLVVAVAAGQGVVVGAAEQQVGAAPALQAVVARLAEELVGARAADHGVVALAALHDGQRQRPAGLVQLQAVAAAQAEHGDLGGVGDGGRSALDLHRPAVHQDDARRVAADDNGVVQVVAEDGQNPGAGREEGGDRRGEPGFQRIQAGHEPSRQGVVRPETVSAAGTHELQK
jgi:hypothetical protein